VSRISRSDLLVASVLAFITAGGNAATAQTSTLIVGKDKPVCEAYKKSLDQVLSDPNLNPNNRDLSQFRFMPVTTGIQIWSAGCI
jgi:hypothetical protein